MKHTPDGYSYKGHRHQQLKFKPHCSTGGTPGIAVESPGAAIWLDLNSAKPFIQDLRDTAAGARRNAAVTRRPWTPKRAA